VLCPNYRGSTGYGKTWQEANRYDLGQGDLEDVMGAVDYLITQDLAQPTSISVTGGSYGGYMTMMAITKYPQAWAAAVSIVPFLNWFTEYANEREDLQYYDRQMMGDPVENQQRWHDCSPVFFLENIETPVLLLAGAHDPRCPAEETQQAIDKLAELGKTYAAHIYPDEGHGFTRIENRIDAIKRQVDFLEKYCPLT
jgi:dipeptidyl aminopeptidase/acylaminoacyl peptidase